MEQKMSTKQRKLIKELEKRTGEQFTGSTIEEASKYITKYQDLIEKIDFRESRKPSKKQQDAIDKITKLFNVEYNGTTMADACAFLDEYMPKYLEYWNEKRGGKK